MPIALSICSAVAPTIAPNTHAEAIVRCGDGPRISAQAFALRMKILEVDPYRGDPRVCEVHPELSVAAIGGAPLPSKRSWNGAAARRRLLAGVGIEIPDDLGTVAGRVPPDDVLDAAAAAWTAGRIALGRAVCLPADPPVEDGLAIWADELLGAGFSDDEIQTMVVEGSRRLMS